MPPSTYLEEEPETADKIDIPSKFRWGLCTAQSPARFDVHRQCELAVEGFVIGRVSWGGDAFAQVEYDSQGEGLGLSVAAYDMSIDPHVHNIQILQAALRKQRGQRRSGEKPPRPTTYILNDLSDKTVPFYSLSYLEGKKMHPTADCIDWERPASEITMMLREHQPVWWSHVNKVCNRLATKQRALFWSDDPTSNGLGNCPAGTNIGDEIVLLSGVKLPVILRGIGGEHGYRFIGYAIMESRDVMVGRRWTTLFSESQGANIARFILC